MEKKKGQIGALQGIIAVLILTSVLIAAGFFIFQEFQDVEELSDSSRTVTNETITGFDEAGDTVAGASQPGFNSFAVTTLTNSTGAETINTANYTAADGIITVIAGSEYNSSNVNVSYTYNRGETAYQGINDTMIAFETLPALLGLIILIAMIGVVLAVIFNVIPGAKMSGA